MKKVIIAISALCLFASTALAAPEITKVGFGAFSSATKVSCTAVGGLNTGGIFSPKITTYRKYDLGTKGMANYSSSVATAKGSVVKVSCFNTTLGTALAAKLFYNGQSTKYTSASEYLLVLR